MSQYPFVVRWKWEVRDLERRSGWRLLNWHMSEEMAAVWAKANAAELRKVEESPEERRDVDGR